MAEFRWIKTSLSLILMLQFTETEQPYPYITVRDGDEVTLPCDSLRDDQKNCNSTEWNFSNSIRRPSVFLVTDGQIDDEAKDKSDRLSVSENCFLVIKKVKDEDAGAYDCIQIISGYHGPDAFVFLSVVTMTELKDSDEVTVNCSVSIYEECEHKVKWLLEGPDNRNMKTSQSLCSASASFSTPHFIHMNSELLKCEVTDHDNGEVKVFPFSPQSSETGHRVLSLTVRHGDEVTLPCDSVIDDQKNCDSTEWLFYDVIREVVEVVLVRGGKFDDEAKDKSDRLSVSENCSLVIKNVKDEDAGGYGCKQFRSGQQQVALVVLSLVTMTELKDSDEVTVNCSVSVFERCQHEVKWLLEGQDIRNMKTSQSLCSASVSFSTPHFIPMISELLKCEVTDGYNGEVKLFPFGRPQSSGWWRLVIVSLGFAAFMAIVVVVNVWARVKEKETRMDEIIVRYDAQDETVTYENIGPPPDGV